MAQKNYNPLHKTALDRILLDYPDVTSGVVFGLPCYKVRGAVFGTLYGDGIGIKLPEDRVKELFASNHSNYVPFQPFGRNRGREFLQINHANSDEYENDKPLFEEAIRYVLSLAN